MAIFYVIVLNLMTLPFGVIYKYAAVFGVGRENFDLERAISRVELNS